MLRWGMRSRAKWVKVRLVLEVGAVLLLVAFVIVNAALDDRTLEERRIDERIDRMDEALEKYYRD